MNKMNYATYRNRLLELNGTLTEKDIYKRWVSDAYGEDWKVCSEPTRGLDGLYHDLYISVRDDGLIYVGKHSTDDLSDQYQGSGIEIDESKNSGHSFKTTQLEFFRSSDFAYAAEKMIVDKDYLKSPYVLNKVLGGMSVRYDGSPNNDPSVRPAGTTMTPEVQSVKSEQRYHKTPVSEKVKNGYITFSMMGVPMGGLVAFKDDPTKTFKVVAEDSVLMNGRNVCLYTVATKLGVKGLRNPLYHFTYEGELLTDRARRLRK